MNFSQTVQDRINDIARADRRDTLVKGAKGNHDAAVEQLGQFLKELLQRVEALEASSRSRK